MESKYKLSDGKLSITLHTNYLKKDGSYIGRASRNVVNLNNLIATLEAIGTPSIDSFAIEHSAGLLKKAILFNIEQGKSVDLFGLGTLFISTAGRKNNIQPGDSSVKGFSIGFRPSEEMQKATEKIQADKIVLADNSPLLTAIQSTWPNVPDGKLPLGKGVRITGANLKLGNKESGIFFIPVDESGAMVNDQSAWLKIPDGLVVHNKPTELEFYVPDSMSPGSYYMGVKTNYSASKVGLKNYVEGTSKETVTIITE